MAQHSYSDLIKRSKELENEVEYLRSSYEATLLSVRGQVQQMNTDIANHKISIGVHSASVLYQMFGGKDYITEEVAGILSRMIHRPDEHCLFAILPCTSY